MLSIDDNLTTVTLEMARDYLAHDLYEGQRPVRLWHARLLADLMAAGRFRRGSKVEFCRYEGRRHCVDGQHTLTAITLCGEAQDLLVCERRVASLAEVGQVYGTFGRELGRTPADVFTGLGIGAQLGFAGRDLDMLSAAVRLVLNGFRPVSIMINARVARDAEFVAAALGEWSVAGRLYLGAIAPAPAVLRARLRHAGVVSIALATIGAANDAQTQARAIDFWERVALNDGLRRGDPVKALTDWLLSSPAGTPVHRAGYVAAAWNAYREGRALDVLRAVSVGKVGITIGGTPFEASSVVDFRRARRAA